MSIAFAALSSVGLYLFSCSGAADGITEVRVQAPILSFTRNGGFNMVFTPPFEAPNGGDTSWMGPHFPDEGRQLMFSVGREPNMLIIRNSWDGTVTGHNKGEFTVADICTRVRSK